ncbi:MAG TPA: hypothetical protein PKD90_04455 [Phnomibacter sp.]|nr:hypothetical protein [Phnomibacter sp.]
MQGSGTVEAMMNMAKVNGVSITARIAPGTTIQLIPPPNGLEYLAEALQTPVLRPATDDGFTGNELNAPGGIGYMIIGNDFIVR